MPHQFVLIINEPSVPSMRAVQVTGLPFTIGSAADADVRLRTPGAPCARIEPAGELEHLSGESYRVVRLEDHRPAARLRNGETFTLGDVIVRFLVGSAASLRRRPEPPREAHEPAATPETTTRVVRHLARLEELERKLVTLMSDLAATRQRTATPV